MTKSTLAPLSKTEFLDSFKNVKKYISKNYIKQEVFLNNMVDAMNYAYSFQQNTKGDIVMNTNTRFIMDPIVLLEIGKLIPKSSSSSKELTITIDKFDDNRFRQYVTQIIYSFDPIKWGQFEFLSKELTDKMHAEANSYKFAALTDIAGIALTAGAGKIVKSVASKLMQNGSKSLAKTISRVLDDKRMIYRIGSVKGNHLNISTNLGMSLKVNGRIVYETPGLVPFYVNEVYNGIIDSLQQNYFSGERVTSYDGIKEYTDMATRYMPMDNDTQNQISIGSAMVLDYGTDFVPGIGNAKSLSSFITNASIADEIEETIRRMKKHKEQEYSDKDKAIKNTLCVEIKNDLNSFEKKTLYRMMKYALTQNKKQLS